MTTRDVDDDLTRDLDTGDDDQDIQQDQKPNPMAELRKDRDRILKEKKEADKRLQSMEKELEAFRTAQEAEAKKGLGLTDKQVELFRKANPDAALTLESGKAFMEEYGFTAKEPDDVDKDTKEPAVREPGFQPSRVPEVVIPEGKVYTADDLFKMITAGGQQRAMAEAIVQRSVKNPGLIKWKYPVSELAETED